MALQARLSIYCGSVDLEEIERGVEFWVWVVPSGWPTRKQGTVIQKLEVNLLMKKTGQSKFKFKAMFVILFDIKGVFLEIWVPDGVSVNQHYSKKGSGNFGKGTTTSGKWFPPSSLQRTQSLIRVVLIPEKHHSTRPPLPVHLNLEPGHFILFR